MQTMKLTATLIALSVMICTSTQAQTLQASPFGPAAAKTIDIVITDEQVSEVDIEVVTGEVLMSSQGDPVGSITAATERSDLISLSLEPAILDVLSAPVGQVSLSKKALQRLQGALILPLSTAEFAALVDAQLKSDRQEVY